MKKFIMLALFAGILTFSVSSCRDQEPDKTDTQEMIEDMQDKGADIKVSDDGKKIKMKTDDEKVKIKMDDEGNVEKVKTKDKS